MVLHYFREPPYYEKVLGNLKNVLANPQADMIKIVIKHVGKILNTITYTELENDVELAVMFQTLFLVTAQNNLEQELINLAQNLPSIIYAFGPDNFVEELAILLEKFVSLPSENKAKQIFATSFHEVS
jgi:hypothetical protein